MADITKYLPKKKREETKPILVNVPLGLRAELQTAVYEDGLTITDVVLAGIQSYLDSRRRGQRRKE